ncbi:WXG100 family type VII secretion target [Serinibacter arcticus]|uniref:Type VI secretion system spike protein VgrG3-like C-terminal domain-containing protein n=1 Tax=Serinibacter arcticus TaxID=1655435 RepID=A0A4Z1DZM6_9MICO|nr:hypothetical protein [Serinibacter arcticus]TGO04328.1 hypothetical protein SERN_1921 [Serinibacter arcticus]
MTTFSGADVQLLSDLAEAMLGGAGQIGDVRTRLDRAVPALAWSGRDQQRFAQEWSTTFGPALLTVTGALETAAQEARSNAQDQERASSGGPGAAAAAAAGAGATAAPGTAAPAAPQDRYGHPTGDLSARYESRGDVATVSTGVGDPGGVSYGTYQLATTRGVPQEFVTWAREHYPAAHDRLTGLTPGTPAFGTAWRELATADAAGFGQAQHEFITEHHFRPGVDRITSRVPGFTLEGRDPVVADVVWSSSVQHGPAGAGRIFAEGTAGRDVATMSDADLVRAVYAERERRFPRLAPRFRAEQADALHGLGD